MLWIGLRGRGEGLRPSAPIAWLAIGGALPARLPGRAQHRRLGRDRRRLRGRGRRRPHRPRAADLGQLPRRQRSGTPTGPFNYYAYVPFELALPWCGHWDDLPAAHAASIFFDLRPSPACSCSAAACGPARRAPASASILAFGWAAYPYTDYALQSNSNDTLIAALLVWALVLFALPAWRGVLLALAVAAKFAPLPLAPLFATGQTGLAARARGRVATAASPDRRVLDRLRRGHRADGRAARGRPRAGDVL